MRELSIRIDRCPECGSYYLKKHSSSRYMCRVCGNTFYRDAKPYKKYSPWKYRSRLVADFVLQKRSNPRLSERKFCEMKKIDFRSFNNYKRDFERKRIVWVWRIPRHWKKEERESFYFVREEVMERNILRQGWGEVSIFDREKFIDTYGQKRFFIHKPMILIKPGDLIIVPAIDRNDASFLLVKALSGYTFEEGTGFGHTVRVKKLFHFSPADTDYGDEKMYRAVVMINEELRIKNHLLYAIGVVGKIVKNPREFSRLVENLRFLINRFNLETQLDRDSE